MKTLSSKQIFERKRAGEKVKVVGRPLNKAKVPPKPSAIEKSLKDLSSAVREININKDAALIIKTTEGVTNMLLKTVQKLKDISSNKVLEWNVTVVRGSDTRIKTLKLKAVK